MRRWQEEVNARRIVLVRRRWGSRWGPGERYKGNFPPRTYYFPPRTYYIGNISGTGEVRRSGVVPLVRGDDCASNRMVPGILGPRTRSLQSRNGRNFPLAPTIYVISRERARGAGDSNADSSPGGLQGGGASGAGDSNAVSSLGGRAMLNQHSS